MDPLKFTYTIKSYDETAKTLDVEFDDGNWARINFIGSIPTSGEELDQLVGQFTSRIEQMQTLEMDDYFVRGLIGNTREADRLTFAQTSTAAPVGQPPEGDVAQDEEAWIRSIVDRVLVEKGLIPNG